MQEEGFLSILIDLVPWYNQYKMQPTFFRDLVDSPGVLYVLLALAFVVFSAGMISRLLRIKYGIEKLREIDKRIDTWWVIWIVVTIAMLVGKVGSTLLFLGISVLSMNEFLNVAGIRKVDPFAAKISFLPIPLQYWFVLNYNPDLFLTVIPVLTIFVFATIFILRQKIDNFITTLGVLHWGQVLTVFSLSHLANLINFDDLHTIFVEPLGLMTYLIVLSQANDVFQFIWGKALGRHKILPLVSPNKTIEGLLGGIVSTTLLAGVIGPVLTIMPLKACLFSGAIISLTGFVGDALMSAIKRDRKVKDFGSFLPGHGGILDRVDSLVIAAPIFFHFYKFYFKSFY